MAVSSDSGELFFEPTKLLALQHADAPEFTLRRSVDCRVRAMVGCFRSAAIPMRPRRVQRVRRSEPCMLKNARSADGRVLCPYCMQPLASASGLSIFRVGPYAAHYRCMEQRQDREKSRRAV